MRLIFCINSIKLTTFIYKNNVIYIISVDF